MERERENAYEWKKDGCRKGVRAQRMQPTSGRTELIASGISAGGARGRSS